MNEDEYTFFDLVGELLVPTEQALAFFDSLRFTPLADDDPVLPRCIHSFLETLVWHDDVQR